MTALAGWAVLERTIALSTGGFLVIAAGFSIVNREALTAMAERVSTL